MGKTYWLLQKSTLIYYTPLKSYWITALSLIILLSLCTISYAQPSPQEYFCEGATYTFTTPHFGNVNYEWTASAGTPTHGSDSTFIWTAPDNIAGPTEVTISVKASNGFNPLCYSTAGKLIRVEPLPDCTINVLAFACGSSTGNIASVVDAGAGATYAWTITGGSITAGAGTNSITFTADPTGTVKLEVKVTTAAGCDSTCSIEVPINELAECTITAPESVCGSSTGNIASVADAGAGATYVWTITGGSITAGAGTNSITFTADPTGTVKLEVKVTTADGCDSTCSIEVPINELAECTITAPESVCGSSTGNIASVADAGAGATYVWTITGGSITAGAGTNSITFTADPTGTVKLEVKVTTADGCDSTCSIEVPINELAECTITAPESVCGSSMGNIASVADAGAGASYAWTITGGSITAGAGTNSITFTADPTGTVKLEVKVTTAAGCDSTCSIEVPIEICEVCVLELNKTALNETVERGQDIYYNIDLCSILWS